MATAACALCVIGMVLCIKEICKAYMKHQSGKVFYLCWFICLGLLLMVGILEVVS